MKVLFTIGGLHPESGGPSRSVPALCEALAKAGTDIEILSLDYGEKFNQPLMPGSLNVTLVDCSPALLRRLQWAPRFKTVLRERCRGALGGRRSEVRDLKPVLIHDTGLWLSTNHAAAVAGRELKLPRIVSPRGMLTKWALQHKGWKKRMAWRLYQQRDLQSAQVLHATSLSEVRDFRASGMTQPVAVIPNGVEAPEARKLEIGNRKSEVKTVLFLGRVHPVKGLTNLVEAWARVQRLEVGGQKSAGGSRPKWRVVVAGGDENGHLAKVKAEIGRQKLENRFEFIDEVEGEAKWDLYRSADLFVLPSHSENFGIVIAEALACGVPVIASRGTPWGDLITHRCGWWVDNDPEILAEALRDAMSRTDEERQEMGMRGRELVEKKYSWPGIASQMKAVYQWMLRDGQRPECVID